MSRSIGKGWHNVCFLAVLVLAAGCQTLVRAEELRDTFRRVKSSVVVVRTTENQGAASLSGILFGSIGLGSGVLISEEGKLLTAAHVVQTADKVTVEFIGGAQVTARVVSSEPIADVALLQLESVPAGVEPARLGNSDKVEVGDEVFVVGAPYGLSHTLSAGHVSGWIVQDHGLGARLGCEFLQTDAAINSGNSGGPIFNMNGEIIGIASRILSHSGGFEGIGFAATTKAVRLLLLERKPFWSGMEGIIVRGDVAAAFNVPQQAGYLVQRVSQESPAWRMGIRPGTVRATIRGTELLIGGDIILSCNGIEVRNDASLESIYESIRKLEPGQTVVSKVLRAGQIIEVLSVVSSDRSGSARQPEGAGAKRLALVPLTPLAFAVVQKHVNPFSISSYEPNRWECYRWHGLCI